LVSSGIATVYKGQVISRDAPIKKNWGILSSYTYMKKYGRDRMRSPLQGKFSKIYEEMRESLVMYCMRKFFFIAFHTIPSKFPF
jgi:hypothetical protein